MTYNRRLKKGIRKGYCTAPYCEVHDGPPLSGLEVLAWELGDDPCVVSVRLGTPEEWNEDLDPDRIV